MKIRLFSTVVMAALLAASCSDKKHPTKIKVQPLSEEKNEAGDSTVYGLACDGCTDSVLVLLSNSGGDPHTYSIIKAMGNHEIYGMPKIGDRLAVLLSADKKSVKKVIDINELMGKWCYMVVPTLKPLPGMTEKSLKKMEASMPDSIRKRMMTPREYGFELNSDKTANAIGRRHRQATDEFSPVTYPQQKYYTAWRLYNGQIILTAGNLNIPGMKRRKVVNDTAQIMMMHRDSLVLKFKNETKGYYRKVNLNSTADQQR